MQDKHFHHAIKRSAVDPALRDGERQATSVTALPPESQKSPAARGPEIRMKDRDHGEGSGSSRGTDSRIEKGGSMFQVLTIVFSLAFLIPGCASDSPRANTKRSTSLGVGSTSEQGWHVWSEARTIPDGDRGGILIGPVVIQNDGTDLSRVILRLDIRHPAPGDLDLHLAYDADEDGRPEVSIPVEFFRSRSGPQAGEFHACPSSLEGTYFFRDSADEAERVFAPLRSFSSGHSFYLAVADTLPEDTGTVLGWAVHTGAEPVAEH